MNNLKNKKQIIMIQIIIIIGVILSLFSLSLQFIDYQYEKGYEQGYNVKSQQCGIFEEMYLSAFASNNYNKQEQEWYYIDTTKDHGSIAVYDKDFNFVEHIKVNESIYTGELGENEK